MVSFMMFNAPRVSNNLNVVIITETRGVVLYVKSLYAILVKLKHDRLNEFTVGPDVNVELVILIPRIVR